MPELQESYDAIVYDKLGRANEYIKDTAFCVEDTSFYISALNDFPGPYVKWFLKKDGFLNIVSAINGKTDRTAHAECTIGFMDPTSLHLPPIPSNLLNSTNNTFIIQNGPNMNQFEKKRNLNSKSAESIERMIKRKTSIEIQSRNNYNHNNNNHKYNSNNINNIDKMCQNSFLFVGRCYGNITDLGDKEIEKIGNITINKESATFFGFDPCFTPNGYNTTFSQMNIDEKNRISHRGKALGALAEYLKIWAKDKKQKQKQANQIKEFQQVAINESDSLILGTIADSSCYMAPAVFLGIIAIELYEQFFND